MIELSDRPLGTSCTILPHMIRPKGWIVLSLAAQTVFSANKPRISGSVTKKSVRPDHFWQPKLANFGPPDENENSKQFKVAK